MHSPIITGFVDFNDFDEEIMNIGPAAPVRVQKYKTESTPAGSFVGFTGFYVQAAFSDHDLFVCRFQIAEVCHFQQPSPEQTKNLLTADLESNLVRSTLITYFESLGYDVRSGILAGSEQVKCQAPVATLWPVVGIQAPAVSTQKLINDTEAVRC